MTAGNRAHSLLEVIIAAAIFVMVSVALSGVWVMYARSAAKSSEVLAANFLARSVTEGIKANGWQWLEQHADDTDLNQGFEVQRIVRGREATIRYSVAYEIRMNEGATKFSDEFTSDFCQLLVTVRWNSSTGSREAESVDGFNNEKTFLSYIYKRGL